MIMKQETNLQSVELIHVPEGETHLNQRWIKEIPVNCIFDKAVTGCGATTLAIQQAGHTILAMPYVSLIKNKKQQHRDTVLGIYEGVTEADILAYINTRPTHKIAVTYDSVPRVASILQRNGINTYKDYFLLIDEWQVLVNSYDFKYDAIRALLEEAKKFKRVTYMSATPIKHHYRLEELKGMKEVQLIWPNRHRIPIETYSVNKPVDCVAGLCMSYDNLKSDEGENWHFFVNSVDLISKAIRKAELKPEQVRVVCSQSRENVRKNKEKLGAAYPIAELSDPVKRFNFYTSTCFEGCDIYDEKGVTFIINDGVVQHTLLDVATLITQIAGRIRNSEYNKKGIIQIFSTTKSREELSVEEYERFLEKVYQESKSYVSRMNEKNDREDIEKLECKERYTRIENGQFVIDRNLFTSDVFAYELRNFTYRSYWALAANLTDSNFEITNSGWFRFGTIPFEAVPQKSFKEAFIEYCQFKSSNEVLSHSRFQEIANIERTKPLIKEAYLKLGAQEVERFGYNTTKILRELNKRIDAPLTVKLIKLVKQSIPYCIHRPDAEIKTILQNIYNELGIKRTAKATDLEEWFETKRTTPKIEDKSVACTTIVYEKIVVRKCKETKQDLFEE